MSASRLLLIPVRGGSVGVPRKALRSLGGGPCALVRTIRTCRQVPDADVYVVTDDDEIAMVATREGVDVLREPEIIDGLKAGERTLDQVIAWASSSLQAVHTVVKVQASSPFLRASTIEQACTMAAAERAVVTLGRDARGLYWRNDLQEPLTPRLNRQDQPRWARETGAVVVWPEPIAARALPRMPPPTMILLATDTEALDEALDIDTLHDFATADAVARRLRIAYRVDGGGCVGMGHIYRAVALAEARPLHEITMLAAAGRQSSAGLLLNASGRHVVNVTSSKLVQLYGDGHWPEIFIREPGPTPVEEVQSWGDAGMFVVTWEDRGPGADLADLTFNDLDSPDSHGPHRYQGLRYAVVRSEFLNLPAPAPVPDTIRRVVLTFGGSDPSSYGTQAAHFLGQRSIGTDWIIGPDAVASSAAPCIAFHRQPRFLAPLFQHADLAITSCGRTTYELAACGVPMICWPQNEHELLHVPLAQSIGAVVIGTPEAPTLEAAWTLVQDRPQREAMRVAGRRHDWGMGAERFWQIVETTYREWKAERGQH